MNLVSSVRARYENLRSLAFSSISSNYTGVGLPFANPVRLIKVANTTDANMLVSFDGIDDMDFLSAGGFFLYDFSSNRADQGGYFEQPAGDRFYVKQESSSPTVGNIYVTIIYASQV